MAQHRPHKAQAVRVDPLPLFLVDDHYREAAYTGPVPRPSRQRVYIVSDGSKALELHVPRDDWDDLATLGGLGGVLGGTASQ